MYLRLYDGQIMIQVSITQRYEEKAVFSVLKRTFSKKSGSESDSKKSEVDAATAGSGVNHQFHGAAKLHEKFPQVRSIAINLMISPPDHETEPTLNGRSFGPDSLAFFEFRCKNVDCIKGGFDVTDAITEGIANGEDSLTGRRVCRGWHGKSRINQIRCHYELNFRINLNYHEN